MVKYPNSLIEFSRNKISAHFNESLQLLCTVDSLELTAVHCSQHSKMNTTKLWFGSTDDLIMRNDDGFKNVYEISRSGRFSTEAGYSPEPMWQDVKKCPCGTPKAKPNRTFVVGQDGDGTI